MRCLCVMLMFGIILGWQNVEASQTDLNQDGHVDWSDFLLFAQAYRADDPQCDLDQNGQVNQADFRVFVDAYGDRDQIVPSTKFAKLGWSRFLLRQARTVDSVVNAEVGEIIEVELFIEGRGESIIGANVFLEFDDRYLQLIPAVAVPELTPFQQGTFLIGTVFGNNTLGDTVGGNGSVFYNEQIPVGFQGEQRAAIGDGVLATFKLRIVGNPRDTKTIVRLVKQSPTGSESGYFVKDDPGAIYAFRENQDLDIRIVNWGFSTVSDNFSACVTQNDIPVSGLQIEVAPFISGQSLVYLKGITDTFGCVVGGLKSGLYIFRARDLTSNEIVGQWHSVPINVGSFIDLTLPIGAPFVVNRP